jgi:cephalosporin-C deacetylase-like acetyl esterase
MVIVSAATHLKSFKEFNLESLAVFTYFEILQYAEVIKVSQLTNANLKDVFILPAKLEHHVYKFI